MWLAQSQGWWCYPFINSPVSLACILSITALEAGAQSRHHCFMIPFKTTKNKSGEKYFRITDRNEA